jgi:hypothetical protein
VLRELVNEADVNKAFQRITRLAQDLKEDIGAVSRENRDLESIQ